MTISYDLSLSGFPPGVKMLFEEASSPLGWTKDRSWYDDSMLCINTEVDGTSLDSGGNINPQTGLTHPGTPYTVDSESGHIHTNTLAILDESSHSHISGTLKIPDHWHTTSGHPLSVAELPSHNHTHYTSNANRGAQGPVTPFATYTASVLNTGYTGGNASHSHGNTGTTPSATALTGNTGTGSLHNHGVSGSITGGENHNHGLTGEFGDHGILKYQEVILCTKN